MAVAITRRSALFAPFALFAQPRQEVVGIDFVRDVATVWRNNFPVEFVFTDSGIYEVPFHAHLRD